MASGKHGLAACGGKQTASIATNKATGKNRMGNGKKRIASHLGDKQNDKQSDKQSDKHSGNR